MKKDTKEQVITNKTEVKKEVKGKAKTSNRAKPNNLKASKGRSKKSYTTADLEKAKASALTFDFLIKEVDEACNLHGFFANGINTVMPREEVSSVVGEDGLVDEKLCKGKENKIMQVCIKELEVVDGSVVSAILSRKALELKVRAWMYTHLKDGMRLKGVVRGMTDYAAFVDVGGGVTGMLKLEDISYVRLQKPEDKLKLGQRLEVVVKKYDKDTGKIELSLKELEGTFADNVKHVKEGEIIEGVVRNRERNGIFVELKGGVVGLAEHVNGVEYGQQVLVHVKKINVEKSKIKLKIIG